MSDQAIAAAAKIKSEVDSFDGVGKLGIFLPKDQWRAVAAALAAAQRVAGEDGLKAEIKQLMDDNGYTANELGKAQAEIKRLRAALALSPGKVSEEC